MTDTDTYVNRIEAAKNWDDVLAVVHEACAANGYTIAPGQDLSEAADVVDSRDMARIFNKAVMWMEDRRQISEQFGG